MADQSPKRNEQEGLAAARRLASAGQYDQASATLRTLADSAVTDAALLQQIGVALRDFGDTEGAERAFGRALVLDPGSAYIRNNLAIVLQDRGETEAACQLFRQNVHDRPGDPALLNNYLYSAQYVPGVTAQSLFTDHQLWRQQVRAPHAGTRPPTPAKEMAGRLRIGFLSADFAAHPVACFMLPLFRALDRTQCQVICLSAGRRRDAMTGDFARAADEWHDISELSDADAAALVARQRVDILFDMAGHTLGNRLGVFAMKPAPMQVSWAGYVGTTGVPEIDYVLADAHQAPPDEDVYYHERVIRLPRCYVPYQPAAYAPDVGPLPALAAGHVTFGSFNHPAKLTRDVIALWVDVLGMLPEARLVLRYRGVDSHANQRRIHDALAAAGLDPGRVRFAGVSAHRDRLTAYGGIDIALDPFPYSGGVTTCEALWMGVPVVTLTGRTFAGRHSTSYLTNVGLTQLIADDVDAYAAAAVLLATDFTRLSQLRAGLRGRMAHSPMLDHGGFARDFMTAMRAAWQDLRRDETTLRPNQGTATVS